MYVIVVGECVIGEISESSSDSMSSDSDSEPEKSPPGMYNRF